MSETSLPTIKLSVGIAIPLLLSLPCVFILYSLFKKRNHTWSFDTDNTAISAPISDDVENPIAAPQVRHTTKQAEGRKKASLATLDIMSFLGKLQQTQREAITPEMDSTSPPQTSNPSTTLANLLGPALPSYTLSILLSLVCGAIYLSTVSTSAYSNAINFPLGISVTCAPFVCFAYAMQGHRPSNTTSSKSPSPHLSFCRKLGFGLAAPVLASIVVGALGAWVSPYVVITFLGIALCTTSVLTIHACFPTITSWTIRVLHRHHSSSKRRQTRSWFSGTGLTAADAEALAGKGQMPRPGEKEDDFVHRMQHEGNSWITETGNGARSRSALLSSFSYSASSMSGHSTPVTPHAPGSAFPRAESSSSVATTPHSRSSGSNQKSRISSSLSNSWITEPTESGVTMSPWRFDTSNEVPPVPALTASTKARYGIPESTSQSSPAQPVLTQAETTFYGEGPSIIHIGDPANMTFASYDSLPIKHGKRSTNFEILSPPAKTGPSKSPSVVSFRKKNKQRTMSEDSEESFHSARNDPCQSIESSGAPAAAAGRVRRDPNQSFPQSVSMSLDDEMYCDARGGSAADNVSLNTDAVETVADGDELRDLGRYQHFPHDDLPPLPVPPARFYVSGQQVVGTSNRGASSSESEIFMPIHLGNSRQPGIHSDLPKGSRGTYSSYSSLASPMFGGYGGGADGEKKSTDPLLMRGKMSVTSEVMDWYGGAGATNPSRMVGTGLRGQVNSRSADAELEAHFKQLSWMAMGNLLVSCTSFAFALPLLINPGEADILATSLYLVAIAIPALSLVTSWITLKKLLLPLQLNEDKRASQLRPFMLQPQLAEVKLEQNLKLPTTVDFSQWQTVLKNRLHSLRLKFRHDHGPSNEGGIIQISQARPSSRRFDKLTNPSIPQAQISVPHPVADIGKKEAEVVDDADETPRPYRFKRGPVDSAPLNNTSDIDNDRLSAYSILHGQGGRVSPIAGYPISPSRSDATLSRPDSMTSSPGAKSIKLASVQHAVRGRMSLGPSFLMGGSQGETIITAGRSVDLEAAIRAEIGGHGGRRERTYSTNQGEGYEISNFAPRVSEDQSRFQSTNRRSTDILGEFGVHEIKQERRRTFDFGRVWSGWKRSHEKGPADPEFAFEGVNPERMDAIMMSDFGNAKIAPQQPHVSRLSTSDYHDTFGGRHSVSTVRESNDLPAFRPSEDFILPGQQGDYPSFDFGRPSIAQDDRASFSVEGHGDASISTPRYPRQRNTSRGPGSTLPEMTAMNFLAEFKGAIRKLGTRAEDTPSREAVRSVLEGLATPHVASKKGSSTSIRSILKVRPSTEVRKIGPSTSIGHSLPPIPIDIAKSLVHKSSTYSIASTGRSTPVGPDEGYTSASHIHLSLPPPRNVRNVCKSSLGPLSAALHAVAEREEPVTVPHVAVRSETEHSDDKLSPAPQQNRDFLAISKITPDNAHDRSASTNTAIEEIETIMAMDSPTTASYLKANLSRPHSVVTESYVGPLSAPANGHQHHLQASQSTQRTGPCPALKSSRSTPAFALASDWTSSRPTGDALYERPSSANDRPSSTYSYLEKELGLPPLPIREAISSARRGSRAGSKTEVQRQVLEKVNGNATRPTQSSPAGKEDGRVAKTRGSTACPEDVENIRAVDENGRSSPRKSIRKPKIRGSTRIGENDASVRVMRF
ncbi:hypothetical protein QFC22_000975 [Naganishia vaughanmartiniae]|uniref:Uncharacterized protein n=1 Tax=Naganishia vaughanmartiniae TaxID=1424756 RepID=A0ACC2XJJ8_9TREE|nr:hypothetical protein QFC22_000975 [Naganishia vaughanmartiniae]